jgi:nucleotide-binding universal stress UspA family protein
MQRIVVGIDTEPPSRTALQWVVERTARRPAAVHLVTVASDAPFGPGGTERHLAAVAQRFRATRPELPLTTGVITGAGIAEQLAAEARDADLLVIGHHRTRIVRSLLAGALPLQVVADAACPVVVVPDDWQRRFGKTVVGVVVDGSSDGAVRFAAQEAAVFGRSLDLVQVELRPAGSNATGVSPVLRAAARIARTAHPGLAVREFSVMGDPDAALAAHGREASLIVVGDHGGGILARLLRRSRTYALLNGSRAPLCVVSPGWQPRQEVPE